MFPHVFSSCAVFSDVSQWSSTGTATTLNKTFLNWPLLRIRPKDTSSNKLSTKTIKPSKIVCGCQLWCVEQLKANSENNPEIKNHSLMFVLYPMCPVVSSILKPHLLVTLILFVNYLTNTFLADKWLWMGKKVGMYASYWWTCFA